MARRSRRGIARLLAVGLVATACAVATPATTTLDPTTTTPPTTSSTTSTTSTTTSTTTTLPPTTSTSQPLAEIGAEVRVPEGDGPFPAVVLVHGGGWVIGSPVLMRPLSRHLTDAGFLTVNTPYQLSSAEVHGFPAAVDDVACAVRYAAAHPQSDGTVAIIGHSAGAHIGAIVALTGDSYGDDCPIEGSGLPERFIGLGGPYDIDQLGLVMLPFFGAGPVAAPEAWQAGNPLNLVDENPGLVALIMHGEDDTVVEFFFASDFHDALGEAGVESLLEVVEGSNHNELTHPAVIGDLIVTWLQR